MQLAVCLCIYITKDHTQRGVQGQVCTLSAIGEGEGFGDGLCLSMKLLATFSPSTSTGSSHHPRLSNPSLSASQQASKPLQGSAFPSLHQSLSKAQHFQACIKASPRLSISKPSPRLSIESGLLCLVCKRDFLLLSCIYIAVGHASHAMQHLSKKPCKPCNATPIQ